jgi:hypothetical protein
MKNERSLKKYFEVTFTYLLGFAAHVINNITTEDKKAEAPIKVLTAFIASLFDAFIDENTSGAPFPNANSVTPASDSDIPNLIVKYSRDGDRYSSAVDDNKYIRINNT